MLEEKMARSVDLIVDLDRYGVMMLEERKMVLMVAIAVAVVTGRVYEDFVLVVCDQLMIEEVRDDIFLVLRSNDLFEAESQILVDVMMMMVVVVRVRSVLLCEVRNGLVDWLVSNELNL